MRDEAARHQPAHALDANRDATQFETAKFEAPQLQTAQVETAQLQTAQFETPQLDTTQFEKIQPDTGGPRPSLRPDAQAHPGAFDTRPMTVSSMDLASDVLLPVEQAVLLALDNNRYITVRRYQAPLWLTRMQEASAPFDPVLQIGGTVSHDDSELTSSITTAGRNTSRQSTQRFDAPPAIGDNISYSRRFLDGKVVSASYSGTYENFDPTGEIRLINPAWRSGVSVGLEVPFFKGAGVAANTAKAEIARQHYLKAKHDTQQHMNYLARNVKHEYWNLEHAYRVLETATRAKHRAEKTYRDELRRKELGVSTISLVAQAQEQYERFRIDELDAKQQLVTVERAFREYLGVENLHNWKFGTATHTSFRAPNTDWESAKAVALQARPELMSQRHMVDSLRAEIVLRNNETEPKLNLISRYSVGGLDDNYANAVANMFEAQNGAWEVGLIYRRAICNVKEDAVLRRAWLRHSQERARLEQFEFEAIHALQRSYQAVQWARKRLELSNIRHAAAVRRLTASEKQWKSLDIAQLDYLLRAQVAETEAQLGKLRAVADYRKAIEEWLYQKGTIITSLHDENEGAPRHEPIPQEKSLEQLDCQPPRVMAKKQR